MSQVKSTTFQVRINYGTGYYVGSSGKFIIVHTTQQEGDIYVAYSEYALGQFAWFTVY